MATRKQSGAAKRNIKKAQARWKSMSKREHSLAQPEGRERKKPGTGGGGKFFRIEVRPKGDFQTFRVQDVGSRGHLERLAGKRSSGSWDTVSWLVSKEDAHVSGGTLVITNKKVKKSIEEGTSGAIKHVKADIFRAHPRKNVPERSKPTKAMRTARSINIRKAQAARKKGR